MTSWQKSNSVNFCVFTCRTILPNVIQIRLEITYFEENRPNNKKKNKKSSDMGSVPNPNFLMKNYRNLLTFSSLARKNPAAADPKDSSLCDLH